MSAVAFSPPPSMQSAMASAYSHTLGPIGQGTSYERRKSGPGEGHITAILMRKLPKHTTKEALRSMLLFAKDLKDADFVPNEYESDHGFLTAVARFSSTTAATEAQAMLDGKPNTAGQANMIVEVINASTLAQLGRRNTIDQSSTNRVTHSVSPALGNVQRQSSRFNDTFQSMEKISPPAIGSSPALDLPKSESSSRLQTLFSPQSPVGSTVQERSRATGKSVIDQDAVDDDTGDIITNPREYLESGSSTSMHGLARRPTNPQIPLSRFSTLSLNTSMSSPPMPNYSSPHSAIQSRNNLSTMSPNGSYQYANPHYHRHNYPPVNPADQNPPCNTLYVGNLPIDTSEDELKAMFSKQRGYKRLCFRTKQNGPMCFVEFEDISFATKALNDLYGAQLHNSVKGGIRLSFSKNPLGVRAGQPGSAHPSTPLSPAGPMSAINGLGPISPNGFSTANGPPPGLSVPPGLNMSMSSTSPGINSAMTPSMMNASFINQGLGIAGSAAQYSRGVPVGGGMSNPAGGQSMSSFYPDHMMGR